MRIWIDTEFNGYQGDLISIALVDEDGRDFYAVLSCANPIPWVAEHVMPILDGEPISLADRQGTMARWLAAYDAVHIVADWPDDISNFMDLLITGPGSRLDTPPLTMEVRRDLDGVASRVPHNALEDAYALRLSQLALEGAPIPLPGGPA